MTHNHAFSFSHDYNSISCILEYYTACIIYFSLDVQAQCFANRDGGSSDGLCTQLAIPFLYPCRRIRDAERTRWISASIGPRWRLVQFIFSLEGYWRIHQYVFLVPGVRHVTRRPSTKVLQGCERMVARGRRVHDQLMARTRPRTSTEYLKINHPEDSFKRLFRQPWGDPCVRPPTTRCSISTNDSDSSKTEHCLSLKDGRKLQRTWYCAVTSKREASGGFRKYWANRKPIHILSQRYLQTFLECWDVLQNVSWTSIWEVPKRDPSRARKDAWPRMTSFRERSSRSEEGINKTLVGDGVTRLFITRLFLEALEKLWLDDMKFRASKLSTKLTFARRLRRG